MRAARDRCRVSAACGQPAHCRWAAQGQGTGRQTQSTGSDQGSATSGQPYPGQQRKECAQRPWCCQSPASSYRASASWQQHEDMPACHATCRVILPALLSCEALPVPAAVQHPSSPWTPCTVWNLLWPRRKECVCCSLSFVVVSEINYRPGCSVRLHWDSHLACAAPPNCLLHGSAEFSALASILKGPVAK